MSESRKGKKHEWNRKKIVQLDLEGNFIKLWDSIKDAEKELNDEKTKAEKEIKDAEKKIKDGKKEIQDAKKEIARKSWR